MAKAPNNVLSDEEIVAELNTLGCPFTGDLLKQFVSALAIHTHQGTRERDAEYGADGKKTVPEKDGEPLHEDNPYDEAEVAQKRRVRSAIERKLNLCYGANAWVEYDGKPKAAPAAPPAAQQAAPVQQAAKAGDPQPSASGPAPASK